MAAAPFAHRFERVRRAMAAADVEALLLSVGPDLPWLCGYEAMPLERLTMLVLTTEGATLVVPGLEAPRVTEHPELFALRPWGETEDPIAMTAELLGPARRVAIGDRTWARFLVDLQRAVPGLDVRRASEITGPLRAVKDAHEVDALHRAGAAVDRIAAELQGGAIPLVGRSEADVSADLSRRILAEGHHRVNFAIVAAGANAASPHHEPGGRIIGPDEVVLCDFGGTMADEFGVGYCSDITRCVWTGTPPDHAAEVYDVLRMAHAASVAAAEVGASCESVDAAGRSVITEAGFGEYFVHRTGHGMGVEEHEDPYIVEGNTAALVLGNCFSIEPGIYLPGRYGFRLEDCVVTTDAGADPLTDVDHRLVAL
jgi:Xaa-Pro aminopeptidase